MSRPDFLYRGTPNKDTTQFTPKELVGLSSSARLVVSATSDRNVATKFIVPMEGLNIKTGFIDGISYYLCADETVFRQTDKGGAIHTFASYGFELISYQSVDIWVNPNPVNSISKEVVSSGLTAMIDAGIQVYFVTPDTLELFNNSPDRRLDILKELVSENAKQNKK
ncbi:hypothetical protein HYT02_03705 [Candidatus Gottesmanbacteria bacterium]|nr:hypothetical protein [Candidatus Gottesmanbacteria bacterium]